MSEWPIEQLQMHCVLFRIPPGTTREAMIEKLRADKRVLIVQPLNEFESAASVIPRPGDHAGTADDPYARLQSNVSALDVVEAHHFSRGAGIRVAIIDTGVDTLHPDLAGRTQVTRNYIDNDEAVFRSDRHGTQVAGLIAAASNNGIGIVGVAPDVKLHGLQGLLADVARAPPAVATPSRIAQALADALAAKAQVINLSLVGPERSAARGADRQGHQHRASSSWAPYRKIRALAFPARLPHVLAVAEAERSLGSGDTGGDGFFARRPATSSRWCPTATTTSPPAIRWRRRRSAAWSRLLLARNQKLSVTRLRELLTQSTERHDTTRGPFLSVNACAALAQWCAARAARTNGDIPRSSNWTGSASGPSRC